MTITIVFKEHLKWDGEIVEDVIEYYEDPKSNRLCLVMGNGIEFSWPLDKIESYESRDSK
jgi:hypothetical protein